MGKRLDLVGKKFNRLKIVKLIKSSKFNKRKFLCKCDCGNTVEVVGSEVKSGHTKSCGCWNKEKRFGNKYAQSHGMKNTKFYYVWRGIKKRCLLKTDPHYKSYGKRGIQVTTRWLKFENFRDDMYASYLEHIKRFGKDTSIDRINNNAGYSKENCRWATGIEQQNNTRHNTWLTFNGETMTIAQWCRKLNIKITTLCMRIYVRKWSIEKSLVTPTLKTHELKRDKFGKLQKYGK